MIGQLVNGHEHGVIGQVVNGHGFFVMVGHEHGSVSVIDFET